MSTYNPFSPLSDKYQGDPEANALAPAQNQTEWEDDHGIYADGDEIQEEYLDEEEEVTISSAGSTEDHEMSPGRSQQEYQKVSDSHPEDGQTADGLPTQHQQSGSQLFTIPGTPRATKAPGFGRGGGAPSHVIASPNARFTPQSPSPHTPTMLNTVLPDNPPNLPPKTFFMYRAQLTFGLKPTAAGVNVATLFKRWIHSSSETLPDFSLLPYDEEKGQQITSQNQAPDDNPDFYGKYYHNHRILQHGNLTGMVSFQCSLPWPQLKKANSTYFNWLRFNNVYLNQTKFKTATLVSCGFLVGAHPGHFRRDEAEMELKRSLNIDAAEIPFQLSARTASVPLKQGSSDKYTFQAVVVETSATFAKQLREAFYSLQKPSVAVHQYPYTGKYQFVPFLQSKEWTVHKILQLAKVHVTIIKDLRPVFVANVQNIHNIISPTGQTLLQGFMGMSCKGLQGEEVPLLHSIHNTGNPKIKVALVTTSHHDAALDQFASIHAGLMTVIAPEFHDKVFVGTSPAGLTGQQIDSTSSCNCSANADELIHLYNPQEGDIQPTMQKRFRATPMTYSSVASSQPPPTSEATQPPPPQATANSTGSISSLTSTELDQLYERLKHHIDKDTTTSQGISASEMEQHVKKSNQDIQIMRQYMNDSITQLSTRLDQMHSDINKQNAVIVGIQREFQTSITDMTTQFTDLKNLVTSFFQSSLPASTRTTMRSGEASP